MRAYRNDNASSSFSVGIERAVGLEKVLGDLFTYQLARSPDSYNSLVTPRNVESQNESMIYLSLTYFI